MFIIIILSNNVYIYQSWERICTNGVSSRTGVIFIAYKKGDITNYISISRLNLDYITHTAVHKNRMQGALNAIIGKNKSNAIKNITIFHTLSTIRNVTCLMHLTNS